LLANLTPFNPPLLAKERGRRIKKLIFIFSYVKIHKDYPEVRESSERSD
jgi:hypothetical protein